MEKRWIKLKADSNGKLGTLKKRKIRLIVPAPTVYKTMGQRTTNMLDRYSGLLKTTNILKVMEMINSLLR
jgi:hypothetical protein